MNVIGKILGWTVRHAFVGILLFAGILAFTIWSKGDVQRWWGESQALNERQAEELQRIIVQSDAERRRLAALLESARADAQKATVGELESQLQLVDSELSLLDSEKRSGLDGKLAKLTLDFEAIATEQKRELRLQFLSLKQRGLKDALEAAKARDAAAAAQKVLAEEGKRFDRQEKICQSAKQALRDFDANWIDRNLDRLPLIDQRKALDRKREEACNARDAARSARERANQDFTSAQAKLRSTQAWVTGRLPAPEELMDRLDQEKEYASKTISATAKRLWIRYDGDEILKAALIALGVIIASPFLIRLFLWLVLAPIAMRRPSIRLHAPSGPAARIPEARSCISVAVRLDPDEELLVRQDYLQTSSGAGKKATQWLLDWTKPITSLVTGLYFLTRIRGANETTTISATRDSFAEVAVLELPEGASCILQPRALAAVVKPTGRPLRITSHYRMASLHAWITMQLRYLAFHGPARLVIKGGRGVRIEAAEKGRIFGQDQLIGFSADLAYSATRTETFWPYFLGREQLFKDRLMEGTGVLVVEEAPLTARRGEVRRGLEGMVDAGMKVFGM